MSTHNVHQDRSRMEHFVDELDETLKNSTLVSSHRQDESLNQVSDKGVFCYPADKTDHSETTTECVASPERSDELTPQNQLFDTEDEETGLSNDELHVVSQFLIEALKLRRNYCHHASHSFPLTTARLLQANDETDKNNSPSSRLYAAPIDPTSELSPKNDSCAIPSSSNYVMKVHKGIFHVYRVEEAGERGRLIDFTYPPLEKYIADVKRIRNMMANKPLETFCSQRLNYLSTKFQLHLLRNKRRELRSPKRDFCNVRKVDTHIHAAACMNQKRLLTFIKKKLKNEGGEVVYLDRNGQGMTLNQIFEEMNVSAYDLSVDLLDVHVDSTTFQRFDKFNTKFNPFGENRLREIFLKTDNYIGGKYFAELIKEVIQDLEESKCEYAEPRISVYGRSLDEWEKLAKWARNFNVYSDNIRWLIQMPRIYNLHRSKNFVQSFQDLIENFFRPLFDATNNPNAHPELHYFLSQLGGFDSVDDESKPEHPLFDKETPTAESWTSEDNPPYSYYLYYIYANMCVLNQFRKSRGMNTFAFRPHSGEAGSIEHLLCAFLVAENIAHGLVLKEDSVIQYLYYLSQIGIAMSPFCNNALFLKYRYHPFPDFFSQGLFVALSTDGALQCHITKEPLAEEYSIATQMWKLSSSDLCELACNSVRMSSFPHDVKQTWLGSDYTMEGVAGNDTLRTCVPDLRVAYRYETLVAELNRLMLRTK